MRAGAVSKEEEEEKEKEEDFGDCSEVEDDDNSRLIQ